MMILKKKKKKNVTGKIFSFKLFILASVLVIIFLGTNLGREFYRKYQIQREIASLQSDIDSLEKNSYKLSQLIEYYKTDEYKEAQARERFGLGKEGEKMIVMIEASDLETDLEIEKEIDGSEEIPNYKKWWNYFFAKRQS